MVGRHAPWPLFEDAAIDAISGLNSGPQRHVPEFNPELREADFGARGLVLNRAFGWLDLLSRLNGLTSLQSFADHRPVPGGMRKWLKKLEKSPPEKVWKQLTKARDKESGPWTDWFPAEQGVTAIEGLIAILQREGWRAAADALLKEFPTLKMSYFEPAPVAAVVAELQAFAQCLHVAGAAGAKFRLARTNPF